MKTLYEVYIVKDDNFTSYNLISPIDLINLDKMSVSINGEEVEYILANDVLYFANPVYVGDKIIIKASILDNVRLFTKNSYSKNSLLKVFSSKTKLKSNNKYIFTLSIGDKLLSYSFLTKYNPFYCTIKLIRSDTGDLLNNATDEQIANVIHDNSKVALEKLEVAIKAGTKENTVLTTIPTYVKDYVRYKTNIDFCYSIYLSMSGKLGVVSKTIGDIQVNTTYKIPYLGDMLSRFKELLAPNQELVYSGETTTVASFVKAQNTTYPVSSRGVF